MKKQYREIIRIRNWNCEHKFERYKINRIRLEKAPILYPVVFLCFNGNRKTFLKKKKSKASLIIKLNYRVFCLYVPIWSWVIHVRNLVRTIIFSYFEVEKRIHRARLVAVFVQVFSIYLSTLGKTNVKEVYLYNI